MAEIISPPNTLKKVDRSGEVAAYFGFVPVESPQICRKDFLINKHFKTCSIEEHYICSCSPSEKSAVLRSYLESGFDKLPQPLQIYYKKPLQEEGKGRERRHSIGLEIFGLQTSAAPALLLRTALSILEEKKNEDLFVEINSVGDKNSFADFERNLFSYIRKRLSDMPGPLRRIVKNNPFDLLSVVDPKMQEFAEDAPKPINFLTDQSRTYLKEVLEYIESFGVPYTINHSLLGNPHICSNVVFRIRNESDKDSTPLAFGFAYSKLSKKLGLRKELPAYGTTISWSHGEKEAPLQSPKTKFALIQLGFEAKLKTLNVVEALRRAGIPVSFSLARDKLTSQLGAAETSRVPFVIIMGQKEALEDTVVVRNMATRVQEIVPTMDLAKYLKRLRG